MVKDLMMQLDRDQFDIKSVLDTNVVSQTEYITNYVSRVCLKKIKFKHPEYGGLVISLSRYLDKEPGIAVLTRYGIVKVDIEYDIFMGLNNSNRTQYYISKIREGIDKFSNYYPFPKHQVHDCLDEFIEGGCINKWIYKKQNFRDLGLKVILHAELSEHYFKVVLEVLHRKQRVFFDRIFVHDPNPFGYSYYIKDIIVENGNLIVTNKFDDPEKNICNIPISQLRLE
jgi:hypothetical protein